MENLSEVVVDVAIKELNQKSENMWQMKLNCSNYCQQKTEAGGIFISTIQENQVIACYYHPTKRHSATANGGFLGGGQVKSIANPGEWAIVRSSAGLFGRKTYYNTLA